MSDSASKWKLVDFNDLGISYEEKPDDITFFFNIIENKSKDDPNFNNVSNLGDIFVKMTAEYWTSSIGVNTLKFEEMDDLSELVNTTICLDRDLSKLRSQYDNSISSFLPTDAELREKTLEGFARYIEFHFLGISLLVVRKCNEKLYYSFC